MDAWEKGDVVVIQKEIPRPLRGRELNIYIPEILYLDRHNTLYENAKLDALALERYPHLLPDSNAADAKKQAQRVWALRMTCVEIFREYFYRMLEGDQ